MSLVFVNPRRQVSRVEAEIITADVFLRKDLPRINKEHLYVRTINVKGNKYVVNLMTDSMIYLQQQLLYLTNA